MATYQKVDCSDLFKYMRQYKETMIPDGFVYMKIYHDFSGIMYSKVDNKEKVLFDFLTLQQAENRMLECIPKLVEIKRGDIIEVQDCAYVCQVINPLTYTVRKIAYRDGMALCSSLEESEHHLNIFTINPYDVVRVIANISLNQ